jgi:hypothetical protein
MKKLIAILAFGILLIPGIVLADAPPGCSWEGDVGMYYGFNGEDAGVHYADCYAGAALAYEFAILNYDWGTLPCEDDDTFCIYVTSAQGWALASDPDPDGIHLGEPFIAQYGYAYGVLFYVTPPCDAEVCDYDTIIVGEVYTNVLGDCDPTCGDCGDYVGFPQWDTLIIHVVESPPAIYIAQDTLVLVDRGQEAAYVPFQICNGDPCAPPTDYDYVITSMGHVGGAINISGTAVGIPGGSCSTVYGIVDASAAFECDHDTLTIIAWAGAAYDTCVMVIHVVEPQPVPLFTVPVVTILVLALILAAAVFMRRRAVSRA